MRNSEDRIVALTLGNDQLASSRVRIGSVVESLRQSGWKSSRIDAGSKLWPVRFLAALISMSPCVSIIQKVVPPTWYSRTVAQLSNRLIFECDDAIHLGYPGGLTKANRTSRRLESLLPLCDRVVVSNALLAEDLRKLGARDVVVFPGPAPKAVFIRGATKSGSILWLGSPSTIENVRSTVYPAMQLLSAPAILTAVGAPQNTNTDRVFERVWTMGLQTEMLSCSQIGVAPQTEDEWSRRKAFYKVLEYLASDIVPVVPNQDAIYTLLGEEIDILAVTVNDDAPATWASAITTAFEVQVDKTWREARDRVFTRWSAARLGQVIVE